MEVYFLRMMSKSYNLRVAYVVISVLPTHDEQKFFEPWIERNYIYKFYNGKLCDIEILDIHELSERENGEWVLER